MTVSMPVGDLKAATRSLGKAYDQLINLLEDFGMPYSGPRTTS